MDRNTIELQNFRKNLYSFFAKRKDAIMNLLDALTANGHNSSSVVELSHSNFFERQYSSITDAIADGLPSADWESIEKLLCQIDVPQKKIRYLLDCTPASRPHARKLEDRHITHSPNPAPGNKPICVGHQYSVLAKLPEQLEESQKHWLMPFSAERVPSDQKGNEFGIKQLIGKLENFGVSDSLNISIGDSLYASEACRMSVSECKNLVHIFRVNSKRNVFLPPVEVETNSGKAGRKKEYGEKMNLSDSETHTAPDRQETIERVTAKGKKIQVTIKTWENVLFRGSREFRSADHPLNLFQITIKDEAGKTLFKRPMWLGVVGERRHELSAIEVYENYRARYDIEHFFRFGKRNLLMDSYQTPDVEHESLWWKLCILAYSQLYLSKNLTEAIPEPWERYLPEYKEEGVKNDAPSSPSKTQRGFAGLLNIIGTPALPCVPRGNPLGRQAGEQPLKRENQPVIFKGSKAAKKVSEPIVSGSEAVAKISNPPRIDELLKLVSESIGKLALTPQEFSAMLINSS